MIISIGIEASNIQGILDALQQIKKDIATQAAKQLQVDYKEAYDHLPIETGIVAAEWDYHLRIEEGGCNESIS